MRWCTSSNEDLKTPHVFFSYSHRDPEIKELIHLFRKACIDSGVVPIVVEPELGENVMQKLRMLILHCDLVVVVISESFSPSISFEIGYSQAVNLPVLFFVKKSNASLFDSYGFRYFPYESHTAFLNLLSDHLSWFKSQFEKPDRIQRKEEQNKIMDILKNSLRQNVLVLGKDSDEEGLAKIKRIMSVLVNHRYVPVKLKDLSEIMFLSPEDKMTRVGGLCRFIIAEDSRPSGHIDELRLCVDCQYITATVREAGTAATWMQSHYPVQYKFMNRFCYRNVKKATMRDSLCANVNDSLEIATEKAIEWAEKRIKTQELYFSRKIYSNF